MNLVRTNVVQLPFFRQLFILLMCIKLAEWKECKRVLSIIHEDHGRLPMTFKMPTERTDINSFIKQVNVSIRR